MLMTTINKLKRGLEKLWDNVRSLFESRQQHSWHSRHIFKSYSHIHSNMTASIPPPLWPPESALKRREDKRRAEDRRSRRRGEDWTWHFLAPVRSQLYRTQTPLQLSLSKSGWCARPRAAKPSWSKQSERQRTVSIWFSAIISLFSRFPSVFFEFRRIFPGLI